MASGRFATPVLCLTALLWLTSVAAASDGDSLGPWEVGDAVADGWSVDSIDAHPEYIRLHLTDGSMTTIVEVTYPREESGGDSTSQYLVQPAPDSTVPERVLAVVTERFRQFERDPDHELAVHEMTDEERLRMDSGDGRLFNGVGLQVLAWVAVGVWAAVLVGLVLHRRKQSDAE
jgi:hypothetical protein